MLRVDNLAFLCGEEPSVYSRETLPTHELASLLRECTQRAAEVSNISARFREASGEAPGLSCDSKELREELGSYRAVLWGLAQEFGQFEGTRLTEASLGLTDSSVLSTRGFGRFSQAFLEFANDLVGDFFRNRGEEAKEVDFSRPWVSTQQAKLSEAEALLAKPRPGFLRAFRLRQINEELKMAVAEVRARRKGIETRGRGLSAGLIEVFRRTVAEIDEATRKAESSEFDRLIDDPRAETLARTLQNSPPSEVLLQQFGCQVFATDFLRLREGKLESRVLIYALRRLKLLAKPPATFLADLVLYEELFNQKESNLSLEKQRLLSLAGLESQPILSQNSQSIIIPVLLDSTTQALMVILIHRPSRVISIFNPHSYRLYYANSSLFFICKSLMRDLDKSDSLEGYRMREIRHDIPKDQLANGVYAIGVTDSLLREIDVAEPEISKWKNLVVSMLVQDKESNRLKSL